MPMCDICSIGLQSSSCKTVSAHDFNKIVKNGFNPFKEDIKYPTGMKLSDLGAAFGLSAEAQYKQWKSQVLSTNTDWMLCKQCFSFAEKYKK